MAGGKSPRTEPPREHARSLRSISMKRACRPTRLLVLSIFCALLCSATAEAQGPVLGQNINMVSCVTFSGGDPFLQRQNEPSLAVSTRNPLHLLAGSNDYRSVKLNADSIHYISTTPVDSGTFGQLLDKPWLAVGRPAGGACTFQAPRGNTRSLKQFPQCRAERRHVLSKIRSQRG